MALKSVRVKICILYYTAHKLRQERVTIYFRSKKKSNNFDHFLSLQRYLSTVMLQH